MEYIADSEWWICVALNIKLVTAIIARAILRPSTASAVGLIEDNDVSIDNSESDGESRKSSS